MTIVVTRSFCARYFVFCLKIVVTCLKSSNVKGKAFIKTWAPPWSSIWFNTFLKWCSGTTDTGQLDTCHSSTSSRTHTLHWLLCHHVMFFPLINSLWAPSTVTCICNNNSWVMKHQFTYLFNWIWWCTSTSQLRWCSLSSSVCLNACLNKWIQIKDFFFHHLGVYAYYKSVFSKQIRSTLKLD